MDDDAHDPVLVHDCNRPQRLGVWDQNMGWQMADMAANIARLKRAERRAKIIGYTAMIIVPLIVVGLIG